MSSNDIERARRQELAVEAAVGGLALGEWLELRRQAGPLPGAEQDGMERAAAAIALARQPRLEPMPRHLLAAVAADADRHFAPRRASAAGRGPAAARGRAAPPAWFAYGGWLAAAASFVAAIGLLLLDRVDGRASGPAIAATEPPAPPAGDVPPGDAVARRDARLGDAATLAAAEAGDAPGAEAVEDGDDATGEASAPAAARAALAARRFVLRRNWAPAGDPAGRGVQGDVVWDARTQTGYMRFAGLRRNDPSSEQYQLWIFDARRDQRYPVDGGVFDVDGGAGEVIVPIRARLPVGSPLAFAVTIERPGGVVVSDRSRLVVIARVG